MKSIGKLVVLTTLFAVCAGCVRIDALIKLQQSGAGKLFFRCLYSESLSKNEESLSPKADKLTTLSQELGEGVKFVKKSVITTKGWKGFSVEYEFSDINKLRLPFGDLADVDSDDKQEEQRNSLMSLTDSGPWLFRYKPGRTNELVAFHEQPAEEKVDDSDPFAEAGVELPDAPNVELGNVLAVGFLKPILQESRLSVTLQVDGDITETNAPAQLRENSVQLFDADMKKFVESEQFEAAILGKWSMERMLREKVDGIHGLPNDKEISVKFR